jgi:Skp family chaperone for outer membrane proteins
MSKIVFYSFAFLAVMMMSCGGENKQGNTTPAIAAKKMGELKIAFYDQDSVHANFRYYKEQEAIIKKKEKKFNEVIEGKQKSLQAYYEEFLKHQKNQDLAPIQIEQYQQNLEMQQAAIGQYQQTEGGKLEKESIEISKAISNKVEVFSKRYCEKNSIDLLLIHVRGGGGQFNYIHPSMEVTKEFTAYLNQNEEEIQKEIRKTMK